MTYEIKYEANPIYDFIRDRYNGDINIYFYELKNVKKIEEWFLEIKYNPNYKYCKDRLNKEYSDLFITRK